MKNLTLLSTMMNFIQKKLITLPASISLSCLKFGKKWCGGSPPGKGKGLPGKACEKGWTKPGKGGGGPPGPGGRALGGEVSPLRLNGVPILGNSPWGRGKENGSLGEGRPRREKISWLLLAAWAACLKIKSCHRVLKHKSINLSFTPVN